jgi:GNAT superfamily N-acetyltransferase
MPASPPLDPDLVLHLESLAARAWPAEVVRQLAGWRLRFTHGVTRRANSVWPNALEDNLSLEARFQAVEAAYRDWQVPACFQISPAAQPTDLDAFLAARGYVCRTPTLVQTAALPAIHEASQGPLVAQVSETWNAEWADIHVVAEHDSPHQAATRRGIMGRIELPHAFALSVIDGRPVAAGLGVVEGAWLGIFSMVTLPVFRRRGAARAVLHALTGWAGSRGADRVYLQVMETTAPARALYEGLGFRTLYGYHYREKE